MKIHGSERGFRLTIGAAIKISRLCPNGDISRINEILDGGYDAALMANVEIAAAMSEGYELARKFEEKDYEPDPLSVEEILSLDPVVLNDLLTEALSAFKSDSATTVAVKASAISKKNKKA